MNWGEKRCEWVKAVTWGRGVEENTEQDVLAPVAMGPPGSAESAFAALAQEICAEIDRQLAVFLQTDEESGPHKARVALRRLTTALTAFAPILKRRAAARLRKDAKAIFRRLGRVRDADVYLQRRLREGEATALEAETLALRAEVREALRKDKAVGFAPGLLGELSNGMLLKSGRQGLANRALPVQQLAGEALDAVWSLCLSHGEDLDRMAEEDRHEFRKDMKSLRYTAEFFEPLWPEEVWAEFHGAMQELQDALGLLNDLAVARRKEGRKRKIGPEEAMALETAEGLWRRLRKAGPFWER